MGLIRKTFAVRLVDTAVPDAGKREIVTAADDRVPLAKKRESNDT